MEIGDNLVNVDKRHVLPSVFARWVYSHPSCCKELHRSWRVLQQQVLEEWSVCEEHCGARAQRQLTLERETLAKAAERLTEVDLRCSCLPAKLPLEGARAPKRSTVAAAVAAVWQLQVARVRSI